MATQEMIPLNVPCSLDDVPVRTVLERLHSQAEHQKLAFIPVYLAFAWDRIRRYKPDTPEEATRLRHLFLPLSAESGRFVYLVARSIGARRIVEFGTSFGISTLYLAAAVRDNGGGIVIGSEIEAGKIRKARNYLEEAGLAEQVNIREGDALDTLRDIAGPLDLVLLDGWKGLYLPILKMLTPALHSRSVILADDVHVFPKLLVSYIDYVRNPENGFSSVTVPIGAGLEYSVRL